MSTESRPEPGEEQVDTFQDAVLTDRSRQEDGMSWCPRGRWLKYHSGPVGYGIQRRALALPLVTGAYTHDLMADLVVAHAKVHMPNQAEVDLYGVAKAAIEKQTKKYRIACTRRGLADGEGRGVGDEPERIIEEQASLIESFGWAAHYSWLPALLDEYTPIMVEEEVQVLLPNSYGQRVIQQVRGDLALERKLGGEAVQVDLKTTGALTYAPWRRQWEDNGQLAVQAVGMGQALGRPVDFAYIFALDKGRREKEKSKASAGLVKQWSPFLYAYYRPGNPPMTQEDWQLKGTWTDPTTGAERRVTKDYQRVTIHEFDFRSKGKPEGMSNQEFWVRSLGPDEVLSQREILGPFQLLDHQKKSMLVALGAEEERWQAKQWALHDQLEKVGWDEDHPDYRRLLDQEAPQTWKCHLYGKDCAFLKVCKEGLTAQQALDGGEYQLRRPHHEPELVQMRARGIEPPPEEAEDDVDD